MIGLVVDSACSFLQELSFPEVVEVGVAIGKIGNSSLRYELAIFKQNQPLAAAQGHFVHVFVDRESRQTVAIPQTMRDVLAEYLLNE
jgi:acyl-CoA thioester hydrolase